MRRDTSWVYILKCADDTYYTGCTTHLRQRLERHRNGYYENSYTKIKRPVKLVWSAEFRSLIDAYAFEKQLKVWKKSKIEALINHDLELSHQWAQSKEMVK